MTNVFRIRPPRLPVRSWAAPIDPAVVARLTAAWGLSGRERASLIGHAPGPCPSPCPDGADGAAVGIGDDGYDNGDDEGSAPAGAGVRVAMLLRLDRLLDALLMCGAVPAEWLRHPRDEYDGRTPLAALMDDPLELWLLCDRLEWELDVLRAGRHPVPSPGTEGGR